MLYFQEFEKINYKFGNETSTEVFTNISAYADIIDQIKDDASFYTYEQIVEGFRPDQLSIRLYNTPIYYWTFYLLNDNIRQQGWPLTNVELDALIKKRYPNTAITTSESLTGIFKVGRTVVGSTSGATGKILHRNLEFGQLIIEGSLTFTSGEEVTSTFLSPGGTTVESITINSASEEYNATHHYENASNEWVDIIDSAGAPSLVIGAQNTKITNYEHYFNENDKLRDIKVIRPSLIGEIATSYKRAIRS